MKYLTLLGLCCLPLVASHPAYEKAELLGYDLHGWFRNKPALDEIFRSKSISSVIEIGAWLGRSAAYFGHQVEPGGVVYAIDTWKGSLEDPDMLRDARLPYLYELFLSNMLHEGLEGTVIPIRMTSDEASAVTDFTADLIYIDGEHTTDQVLRDIRNWHKRLNFGGVICGNCWDHPPVKAAVVRAAKELNMLVTSSPPSFWQLLSKDR